MLQIAILIPEDYVLSGVANLIEVFETANLMHYRQCRAYCFKIQLIQAPEHQARGLELNGYSIKSTRISNKFNLVLIPPLKRDDLKQSLAKNTSLLRWLQNQYKQGAEVASFCSGAFLFAESGLLNGRLATTHVDVCPDFILSYPLVFVKPGRTLTVDWNCYTSGGASLSLHLLVYLIQKFCGNEMAVKISKAFSIEPDRNQQNYFSTFRPIYSHNDQLIKQLQKQLEENYLSIKTIDEVTKKYPSSRRNLVRRFIKSTGLPPLAYLQNIRIEKAKQLLETSDKSVSEIITATGYSDPKSFRKIFIKLVGIPPLAYRAKFRLR